MATTLGNTQTNELEILSDAQLLSGLELAKQQNAVDQGREIWSELQRRKGAGYATVVAANQLETSTDSVNMEASAPVPVRLALSFIKDPGRQQVYLNNKYGRDNVATVKIDDTEKYMVREGGQWSTVDEFGSSPQDVTIDIADMAPQVAAEAATAYATGGLTNISRVMRFILPSAAAFVEGVLQDAGSEQLLTGQANVKGSVKRRFAEESLGLGIEGVGRGTAKLLLPKRKNEVVEAFDEAVAALKEKGLYFGGLKKKGGWIRPSSIDITSDAEQVLLEVQRQVSEGQRYRSFAQHVRQWAEKIQQEADAAGRLVASAEKTNKEAAQNVVQSMAQHRLANIQQPIPVGQRGAELRGAMSAAYDANVRRVESLYESTKNLADKSGVTVAASDVDNVIESIIMGSDLPIDQKGELIKKYAPGLVRKWKGSVEKAFRGKTPKPTKQDLERQKLLQVLGEDPAVVADAPVELTFSQLYGLQKVLAEDVNFAGRAVGTTAGNAQPILKKIDGELRGMLSEMADDAGDDVGKLWKQANQEFADTVVPFRKGDLSRAQAKFGEAGFSSDETLAGDILFSKNAAENVRQLKKAGAQHPRLLKQLQDELNSTIVQDARLPNGYVDIAQLEANLGTINREVFDEVMGKGAYERVRKLKNVVNLSKIDLRKMDTGLVEQYITATSDREARDALMKIRQYSTQMAQESRYRNKLVRRAIEVGRPEMLDPTEVAETLWDLNATELKDLFAGMPDDLTSDSFKNAMMVWLWGSARKKESTAVLKAAALGHDIMFDPVVMGKKLKDKKVLSQLEAVFEPDEIDKIHFINQAYAAYVLEASRRSPSKMPLTGYVRGGAGGLAPRFVAALHGSTMDTIKSFFNKAYTEKPAALYGMMWPVIAGGSESAESLIMEAARDPEFKEIMLQMIDIGQRDEKESDKK